MATKKKVTPRKVRRCSRCSTEVIKRTKMIGRRKEESVRCECGRTGLFGSDMYIQEDMFFEEFKDEGNKASA